MPIDKSSASFAQSQCKIQLPLYLQEIEGHHAVPYCRKLARREEDSALDAYALSRRPDAAGIAICADLMGLIAAPL